MIDDALAEARARMKQSVEAMEHDLAGIRTSRASPALVERLRVDYYDTPTPLKELALISTPEPQLLSIRPFDPGALKDIERAILQSDLGLTPNNDGKLIRLQIPTLTEERRRELIKVVAKRVEDARIAVRICRRDAIKDLQELENEKLISEDDFYTGKKSLQDLTDEVITNIDTIGKEKDKEILEI
jgi:ribosome recycling factor